MKKETRTGKTTTTENTLTKDPLHSSVKGEQENKKENQFMKFETLHLDPRLSAAVEALGYTSPTPIQAKSIPLILKGRDLTGIAQTGTGKTAAFALPILQRLLKGPRGTVRALIIAPTRELTEQTHEAFGQLGRQTGLKSASIYGGVSIHSQITAMRKGVEIVSACPGRLLDHMQRGTIDLSRVEVLVLDEADRMFDMGFLPDIRKIVRHLPTARQTLLFSATMPDDVRDLTKQIQKDPVRVQIGATAPADTVSHTFYPVESNLKNALLETILDRIETGAVLVFTRTKHRSKSLARRLEKAGYGATALHGNLSQNKRQSALEGFRSGRYRILVATDVAARGIDVRGISHVINYDIPDTVDAYTHRTGRTGRASETGDAFTFVSSQDKDPLRSIAKVLGNKVTYAAAQKQGHAAQLREKQALRRPGGSRHSEQGVASAPANPKRSGPKKSWIRSKAAGTKGRRSSAGKGALGSDLLMSLAGHPRSA